MEAEVLVEVERNNIVESRHRGWIAVCDAQGNIINGTHKKFPEIFIRSSLKPIQALPFLFSGAMDKFNFGLRELAVICSSHSGEDIHRETVKFILDTIGLTPDYLKCGTHVPYSADVARQLIENHQEPDLLHCNCSGKHAGMLAACLINKWDLENYYEYSHPLQQSVRNHLGKLLNIDAEALKWGIDGCNVPTYTLPLDKLAIIFGRIINSDIQQSEYCEYFKLIKNAYLNFPQIIAGKNRVDTQLMQAFPDRVISKIGGEAILGLGLIKERISMAIKIEDGINRPMLPAIVGALEKLGLEIDNYPELKNLKITSIYNNLNIKIGEVKPAFKFLN